MINRGPITVDDRQQTPPSDVRAEELKALGAPAFVRRLDLGDYQWTIESDGEVTAYLVEEKLINDFINSASDGRLGRFVQGEVGDGCVRSLLLVGAYEYGVKTYNGHWSVSAVDNLLVSIQQSGVSILRAVSPAQAPERIVAYWNYTGNEHSTLNRPVRPMPNAHYLDPRKREAVRFLMCVPGVGEKRARALVDEHHTVEAALDCLRTNVKCEADGIGPKVLKDAKEFFACAF